MLKSDMIVRIHRALGDRAHDIPDTEIEAYMNSVWQFQIPDIIPGFFRETTFILPFTLGVSVYNLDTDPAFGGRCRSINTNIYYDDGVFLEYLTDERLFYTRFPIDDMGVGRPRAVFHHARELRFDLNPDVADNVNISAIAYQEPLPDIGLPNDNHAFTVVRGATRDLAGDLGYDEIFQRYAALFDQSVRRMSTQTLSRSPGVIPRTRDF